MFERFSNRTRIAWFIAGIIGSVVCQIFFLPISQDMIGLGYDIIDLEFAWTNSALILILDAWQPIHNDVWTFMWVDMLFPIFYFLALSGWSLLVRKNVIFLIWVAALASVFDYIENTFTFVALLQYPTLDVYVAMGISLFATLKFLLIIFVIAMNLWFTFDKLVFKKNTK